MRLRDYLKGFIAVSSLLITGGIGGYYAYPRIEDLKNMNSIPAEKNHKSVLEGDSFQEDVLGRDCEGVEVISLDIDDFEYSGKNGEFSFKGKDKNGDVLGSRISNRNLYRSGKRDVTVHFYRKKMP